MSRRADLPETQVASATRISEASVKAHAARAMSSLRAELRQAGEDDGRISLTN